jgi:transposase-like protein
MAKGRSGTSAGTGAATDGVTRVEIVTRGEARRSYTPEEKARLLTEAAEPGARVLLVAQRHGVSPSLVYRWRRQAERRAVRRARPRPPAFLPVPCCAEAAFSTRPNPQQREGSATRADPARVAVKRLRVAEARWPDGRTGALEPWA